MAILFYCGKSRQSCLLTLLARGIYKPCGQKGMWSKKSMELCASVIYNEWSKIKKLTFFGNGKVIGFWKYHSCRIWTIFGNFRTFGVNIAIVVKQKLLKIAVKFFRFFIIASFTPNALKLPKIAQNQHDWYFQNPLTLPFPKSVNFLLFGYSLYSTPVHHAIDFFDHIPFWPRGLWMTPWAKEATVLSSNAGKRTSNQQPIVVTYGQWMRVHWDASTTFILYDFYSFLQSNANDRLYI